MISMLHKLTRLESKAIVLTIHQPRIEIYNKFDSVTLMVNGSTLFFGSPGKATSTIAQCIFDNQMTMFDSSGDGLVSEDELKVLLKTTNPADMISDVLLDARSNDKTQILSKTLS